MGRMVIAMAMTRAVMSVSMMQWAEAQTVQCLTEAGAGAPFSDATAVVQQLRVTPGQCCVSSGNFCSPLVTSGNAVATICGSFNPCPNCADAGKDLN